MCDLSLQCLFEDRSLIHITGPPSYKFLFSIVCLRLLLARYNTRARSKNSRSSRYELHVSRLTVDVYRFPVFFLGLFANMERLDKAKRMRSHLPFLPGGQGKEKRGKRTKFRAISLATVLHNVNGVYLFYGLFRAEPTGGPKSSRRKRRAGRASE